MADPHTLPRYADVQVGDPLPSLHLPPLTRQQLAVYCGASGDHNPVHVDIDFARQAGLGDVIAHGMLVMAWMGRCLTGWAPQSAVRSFDTRFLATTRIGDAITCEGRIVGKSSEGEAQSVRVHLTARDQRGEIKTEGEALVELP